MPSEDQVDLILNDCFFAVGQMVSTCTRVDFDAIVWLRDRYADKFLRTIASVPNAWPDDRDRLTAVSRYLALRAVQCGEDPYTIDAGCVAQASAEVEAGCRMKAAEQRAAQTAVTPAERLTEGVGASS